MTFRAATALALLALSAGAAEPPGRGPHAGNPVLPGYYADPSIVRHEGAFYVYATLDPWGGETLGCWTSPDFRNWTYRVLNWPTKRACRSPTSGGSAVWAPSVVRAKSGKFFMYVSVGSEVWAGTADHPLGPWRNALGDRPLIPGDFRPGYHMIDAEGFVDDDGTGWLYWGSGHGWKNGKCWAVRLKPDMVTFDGEVRDVTPANYFEGPIMVKRGGRYFLMYSQGVTIKDTYQVHYAVGDHPLGPFTEAANSPILVTDKAAGIVSPGHHTVFRFEDRDYILYHRHSIPFDPQFVGRQVCVDELRFTADGRIEKVAPTHDGPPLIRDRARGPGALPAKATASGEAGELCAARFANDDNYATLWRAPGEGTNAWLQLDLGAVQPFKRQAIRFEYAWKPYRFTVDVSDDGQAWRTLEDRTGEPAAGSPVLVERPATARFVRLVFPSRGKESEVAVIEWEVQRENK